LLAWRWFNGDILTFRGHGGLLPDGSRWGSSATTIKVSVAAVKRKLFLVGMNLQNLQLGTLNPLNALPLHSRSMLRGSTTNLGERESSPTTPAPRVT